MSWNWQLPNWPHFSYNPDLLFQKEKRLLLDAGSVIACLKNIYVDDYQQFVVEILSLEGQESSRIEGEVLDRESLQSSIKQQFGLNTTSNRMGAKEAGMAKLLCDVYETFDQPLTHEMLWQWHAELFNKQTHIDDRGKYRTHPEPMQIVSRRYDAAKVFFEAVPSSRVPAEMDAFIDWYNIESANDPILGRAAVAHVYFESIHPFEDGNGRIGRILVEKILSQSIGRPVLIAVSRVLEKWRVKYYSALGRCNRTLEVQHWVEFFAEAILQAQQESMSLLHFLIAKSKMLTALAEQLNPRQEKVLIRMFSEGLTGFKGGLSAENYIKITKTTRATATRDLTDLVLKGALVKTGELRHTRYWLNLPKENWRPH